MTLSSRFSSAWMFFFAAWYGCAGQPHAGRDGMDASAAAEKDAAVVADVQALAAAPSVVTLNATADTYIAQATATQNYGTATRIDVTGVALSGWEAGLVQFDATAIRNAVGTGTLQSASLQLAISSTALGIGGSQVTFNRMTSPWTEQGATWLCANDTDNSLLGQFINNCSSANSWGIEWWSFQPRPYVATATATVSVPFGMTGALSADVTEDIKAVLTGGSHYGWFVSSTASLSTVWVRFSSRQGTTAPKLVLTFTPPCVPTGTDNNCDGIDNNCNGTIDEGYVGSNTSCGLGACARTGMTSCVTGMVRDSCLPGTPAASDSSCNGVDDNCNGSIDEGYVVRTTQCGTGACARTGTSSCVSGTEQTGCVPGTPAATDTTCDNVDDNCDGVSDEGFVTAATSCTVNGCSATGTLQCVNHATVDSCTASPVCVAEVNCSDTLDNDSDGKADCGDSDCHCLSDHSVETLFGATLTDYWDARAGVATSGGRVTAWLSVRDGTPLNAPPNAANRPVFSADGTEFGSMPVVKTSIASQAYLSGQLSATALPAGARPYIAIVHRSRALGTETASVIDATSASADARLNLYTEQTSAGSFFCPGSPTPTVGCQYLTSAAVQSLHPVISEVWLDTDGLHFAQDGIEQTTTSGSVADQPLVRAIERLVVGALSDGSQLSESSFAQIVVTSSVPNAELRAAYRKYARGAWALHRCGDGFLDSGEQCDDGNTNDADACSNACTNTTTLATTPAQVLGTSVVEWWDARSGLGAAAGGVTAWQGQKNNTLLSPGLLAPSTRPSYATDDENFHGRAIVQTSIANNAFLAGSLGTSLLPLSAQPYIAIVHRTRAANTAKESIADIVSSDRSSTRLSLDTEDTASLGSFCPNSPAVACQSYNDAASEITETVLTELWIDNDGAHYAENGHESALTPPVPNQTLLNAIEQISLGARGVSDQVSNSNFAQIVLAKAPPTSAQRADYLRYVCAEWGLSICADGYPLTGSSCNPAQPSCGLGRECRNGVGTRFGRSASDYVCWDVGCDDNQSSVFECGSFVARCGTCPACTPDCTGKQCGSDGCGGSCGATCAEGTNGCRTAADCADGLTCLTGADGLGVCRLEVCADPGTNPCSNPANAGLMTDCGLCPACTPDCGTDRVCGAAPNGCGTCDSVSLTAHQFCTADGTIGEQYSFDPDVLPEGAGTGATDPDTVGTLPGAVSVNAFGQGTYSIPLDLPPGRQGFGPNLTVTYNHAAENGYLGIGWGITGLGLSAIQRCERTIAQDGQADAIRNSPDDRFCLDGNRLVLFDGAGTYGADGTEYRTELETFSKIIAHGGSATEEPHWFEVWTRDGLRMRYQLRIGGGRENRAPLSGPVVTQTWLLTKVLDRFDNEIQILYAAPGAALKNTPLETTDPEAILPENTVGQEGLTTIREYYPSKIKYAQRDGFSDRYIEFKYKDRHETVRGYHAGAKFVRTKLLEQVVAKVQGRIIYQYDFGYDEPAADSGRPSQLKFIQQCARPKVLLDMGGLSCKPATFFEYNQRSDSYGPTQTIPQLRAQTELTATDAPLVLDLDGDGKDEVLAAGCTDSESCVQPTACFPGRPCNAPTWRLLRNGAVTDTSIVRKVTRDVVGTTATTTKSSSFVIDYDRDGKDDIVELYGLGLRNFRVLRLNSDNLEVSLDGQLVAPAVGSNTPNEPQNVTVADVNGDRIPDLVYCLPSGRLNYRLHDGLQGFGSPIQVPNIYGCGPLQPIDLDGNGQQELLTPAGHVFWPLTGRIYRYALDPDWKEPIRIELDVNGDGLSDIAELAQIDMQIKLRVWISNGVGFSKSHASTLLASDDKDVLNAFWQKLQQHTAVVDENADGLADLIIGPPNDALVLRGQTQGSLASAEPFTTLAGGQGWLFSFDQNHDGLPDLASEDQLRVRVGAPSYTLSAVTDGLGARSQLDYVSLTQTAPSTDLLAIYTHPAGRVCTYPTYCRYPRGEVVRTLRVWDTAFGAGASTPEANSYVYSYNGFAADLYGRGSLGFSARATLDAARGLLNTKSSTYDNTERDQSTGIYPFVGLPSKEEEVTVDTTGDFRVTTVERPRDPMTNSHEIRHPNPATRSVFAFFARETEKVVSNSSSLSPVFLTNIERSINYDRFGNAFTQETRWLNQVNQLVDSVTISTDFVPSDTEHLARWLISLPRRSTVLGFGEALSSSMRYFRYAEDADGSGHLPYTGRPEAIIESSGALNSETKSLTRSMIYDVWGNTTDIALSGETVDGQTTRSTHIEYDDLHMLPKLVSSNGHDVTLYCDYASLEPIGSAEEGKPGVPVRQWSIPDGFGRPSALYARDGSATTFDYQSVTDGAMAIEVKRTAGAASVQRAPGSKVVLDVLGREVRRESDAFDKSLISETHYNALGWVDGISRAREGGPQTSDFTHYTYDTGGRPTSVSLPDGTNLEYCYLNNVRCERDQRGIVSCEVYNTHGRLIHRVEPLAAATAAACATVAGEVAQAFSPDSDPSAAARAQFVTTRYHYYPLGNVLSVTDAAGHVTRFQRDERGEQIRNLIHPDSGTWSASYNAFNELENEVSPDTSVSVFHYDPFGRLTERVDQGANPQSTRFNFDFVNGDGFFGELNSTVSTDGVEQHFEYDLSGHVSTVTVTDAASGLPQPLVKHIDYDELQRPSLIRYDSSSGAPLSYRIRYNTRGYVAGYDRPNADPALPDIALWTAESADNYGLLTSLSYGNGVADTRTYHPGNGLPDTQTLSHGGELQFLSHTYTADHRLELFTRRDGGTNTSVKRYEYDALKRVKSAVTHDGSESGPVLRGEGYDYDATGNLTTRKWWDAATVSTPRTWTYHYDDAARPHAVSSISEGTTSSQFHYQSDGSMDDRSDGVQGALHIDSNRRHMPFQLANAAGTVSFHYDAFDHRTRKSSSASETLYLDDHYSRVKANLTSGSEEHLIVGSEGAAIAEIVRSPSGSDSVSYLHNDGLGSTILVTDAGGAAVQRRDYEAFGQHSGVTGTPSASVRPDFTGEELDGELGLVNLHARLYDPATGRFLAIDPLISARGGSQRLNPYSYVNNDPVNYTDRSGMQCDDGACLPPQSPPGMEQQKPEPPVVTAEDPRQRGGGGTGTQPTCTQNITGCRPITPPKQAKKQVEHEVTAPAANIHAAGEGLSLGPTGAPVWTAQQLEVLRASQGSMVPNKLLGDIAPQVDQSAETFRDAFDLIFYVDSGIGLLKLGYGLAKAGAKYGILPIIRSLAGSSEEILASRAARGSVGAMRRLLFDAEASAQRHIPGIARPGAAAGPINGQAALDASIEVGANTSRRVGIDYARGEYVVFDEHAPGLFHGHVRSWDELTNAMQAQLRRWGMADAKGRILIGD